jgi:glycosyltransferase involved in cell wall biosynthesis
MSRFSLIVATVDRTDEFSLLLQSLAKQEMRDFELIVVDQNPDDRLSPLLEDFGAKVAAQDGGRRGSIQVKRLHCIPGVSRARNLGLRHSTGEILAFPDDDCWYHPDTLQSVDAWFKQHEDYGILSVGSRDEQGHISGNPWWQPDCDLKWINIFYANSTYAYFVRRPPEGIPLVFDETLGPGAGTKFGSGEDTDVLLTLMSYGIRGRFHSVLHVGHPRKNGYVDLHRAERYGGGCGRVLAKHSNPLLCFGLVAFDFTRAALRMLLGDRGRALQRWAHGQGMIRAYFSDMPISFNKEKPGGSQATGSGR